MDIPDSTPTAALLLERVSATVKAFEDQYRETGAAYNVFKVMRINKKEVEMCRVLSDLLDPKGLHYQGNTYLKLFMDMVVNPLIGKTITLNPVKTKVTPEYSTEEGRFIDIVISDGAVFIPIEVKIYAGEQEKQLSDYAAFSKKMNAGSDFIPVLFLTPDGRESNEATKDSYISASFEKHIIPWLVKCLNLEETGKAPPVREVLKQFIKSVKSFCGQAEDEAMEKSINALIEESRGSFVSALLISKAVGELKFDFDNKAWEIFKEGEIFKLVKSKIPDTEYLEGDDDWYFLYIPTGSCVLNINYNMRAITVQLTDAKNTAAETVENINKTMSNLTGLRNEAGDDWGADIIWVSTEFKYPGLEDIEDDIYKYELYKIYSKDPQSVADKIVAIAMNLKNI